MISAASASSSPPRKRSTLAITRSQLALQHGGARGFETCLKEPAVGAAFPSWTDKMTAIGSAMVRDERGLAVGRSSGEPREMGFCFSNADRFQFAPADT
jgi:hypothetical protein